jgi:NAD(P)-dependent dehydrogenase (short-subunit alcohol dehydrogenase family)
MFKRSINDGGKDLKGKWIVVAGGTGDVGEGIVRALLNAGASVIVPVRTVEKGERLRTAVGVASGLRLIAGEVGVVAGAAALAARVADDGPLDGVIASLGGWWSGDALVAIEGSTWDRIITDNLTSHFAVSRAFAPLLAKSHGTYVQVLGGAALSPMAGSSLVSITAAAVMMMGRVMEAESAGTFVVRQILIETFVATRSRAADAQTGISAETVGEFAAGLITHPGAEGLVHTLPAKHAPANERKTA